jgi:hypothetical protein
LLLVLLLGFVPSARPQAPTPLENCLIATGLKNLAGSWTRPWDARVTLTVSEHRDASRLEFMGADATQMSTLVFGVLPLMRFDKQCIGRRLDFRVRWEPSRNGGYGMAVRRDALIVTGLSFALAAHRHGGPLQLDVNDLANLRQITSLHLFLKQLNFDPGY